MPPRALFPSRLRAPGMVVALAALAASAWADRDIPIGTTADGMPTSSAIFRNELTQVEITDEAGKATDFDGLAKGTTNAGSGLKIHQKLGEKAEFDGETRIGVAQSGSPTGPTSSALNQTVQSQAAANQAAMNQSLSSDTRWGATWQPVGGVTLAYSTTSSHSLSEEQTRTLLLNEDNAFSATWKAAPHTTLSLSDDRMRMYDWGTEGFDSYHTTALGVSQELGGNVTFNASPAWLQNASGGWNPYQLTGPQLSSSFDWKPAQDTKWTLGGAWNRLEEQDPYAEVATAQTTKSFFLAYDRALTKNLHLQLRSDYSNLDAPRATVANPAQLDQVNLRIGQRLSLSDSLSARFDMSQCFQQQDRQAWGTSESMATLSLQKSF